MTEAEWLGCKDAWTMLVVTDFQMSGRKLRLFACACCRVLWAEMLDQRSRQAIEAAERYADGLASPQDLLTAQDDAGHALRDLQADWPEVCRQWRASAGSGTVKPDYALAATFAAWHAATPALYDPAEEPDLSSLRSLLVCVEEAPGDGWLSLDGPLRDIVGNPFRPVTVDPKWFAWNNGTVPALARRIYGERAFGDLPILADALEDAGCTDSDILGHCRQPGEHVRGCWVVDLVLGKK